MYTIFSTNSLQVYVNKKTFSPLQTPLPLLVLQHRKLIQERKRRPGRPLPAVSHLQVPLQKRCVRLRTRSPVLRCGQKQRFHTGRGIHGAARLISLRLFFFSSNKSYLAPPPPFWNGHPVRKSGRSTARKTSPFRPVPGHAGSCGLKEAVKAIAGASSCCVKMRRAMNCWLGEAAEASACRRALGISVCGGTSHHRKPSSHRSGSKHLPLPFRRGKCQPRPDFSYVRGSACLCIS